MDLDRDKFRKYEQKWTSLCDAESEAYFPCTVGEARVIVTKFIRGRLDFYFTKNYVIDPFNVAVLGIGGKTVMSLTPMELQSHLNHIRWANGDVFVAGLGLGYYVRKIIGKEDVSSITVIEKSADVIRIFDRQFPDVAANPKLTIMQGDVLDGPCFPESFDYAYFDIWAANDQDVVLDDVSEIVGRFESDAYGFWSMEKTILDMYEDGADVGDVFDAIPFPIWQWQKIQIVELIEDLTEGVEAMVQ